MDGIVQRTELEVPIVPRGEKTSISINLSRVLIAEQRGEEVSAVTPHKAPELLATFNRAYLDASEIFSRLKLEQARGEDAVAKAKALVLIDKLPGLLKEKGLSSSADIREALVESDTDYQKAKERLDMINAMVEYIKGKMRFLENAYTAVKKIMDTENWSMLIAAERGRTVVEPGEADSTPVGKSAKFGKPL